LKVRKECLFCSQKYSCGLKDHLAEDEPCPNNPQFKKKEEEMVKRIDRVLENG